jgi:hypothetical protein
MSSAFDSRSIVGQNAKPAAHRFGFVGDIQAIDRDPALLGTHQRVEHAQRGRLARAIGTEQAGNLTVAGEETHPVDRLDRASLALEGFVQIVGFYHCSCRD